MIYKRSIYATTALMAAIAMSISGCETTPQPVAEPVVEAAPEPDLSTYEAVIFEVPEEKVEEVPSIDIAEWEAMQAEKEDIVEVPDEPVVELTPLERAAKTSSPDRKIKILSIAGDDPEVLAALNEAYRAKLDVDRAADDGEGVAAALVYFARQEVLSGGQDNQVSALEKYIEAQKLDPSNTDAPEAVSSLRDELSGYADRLHKEATTFFVGQDFQSAVNLWDVVLMIAPDNRAARDWRTQANKGLSR